MRAAKRKEESKRAISSHIQIWIPIVFTTKYGLQADISMAVSVAGQLIENLTRKHHIPHFY